MNRTNLCIRMLQLLKARGKMNTTQLATELEVNPRNIREFKKELVLAGYNVEEVKGRYGGYILNDEYDLPGNTLDHHGSPGSSQPNCSPCSTLRNCDCTHCHSIPAYRTQSRSPQR